MTFRFIAAQAGQHPVTRLCAVLEVSESGYYAWRSRRRRRAPSQRAVANADLVEQIQTIHAESRGTYGSPRVHAALRQQGVVCNRKRVARLMHQLGLRGCDRRQRRVRTTDSTHGFPVAPNLLRRDFTATAPNQTWLGDITYLDTKEGFVYLASLEDAFSRKIVGWALGERLDRTLVERALQMALQQRCPAVGSGLVHHSDRGSQYASLAYRARLDAAQITVSMSRQGDCYDNAMKESFFATLKSECAREPFATRAQARSAVFAFLEGWYNRRRLHSSLGYLSPDEFERHFERQRALSLS